MSTENGQQPKHDESTSQNGEAYGETSQADTDGIMTIDVERLSRPEHENGKEVGAGDESDDERQGEDSRILSKSFGEHGIFGEIGLPDQESNQEHGSED